MTFTPNAEFSTQIGSFIGKFLPELLVTGLNFVWVQFVNQCGTRPMTITTYLYAFRRLEAPNGLETLTQISDSITSCNVNSSQLRSFFERFRLLLKIGSKPRSRLQQIAMWLDRSSLGLPIPWKVPPLDSSAPPPVVVGATGGSGTRIMAQVLRKAGWFMGDRVNPGNEDSLPMAWFLTKWLKILKDFPNVEPRTLARARRDFERMIYLHRRGISSPDARWGWKNPRSLWLILFLAERFPELKFIHMIRDARDMMLSENIYFLRQNGYWLLGPDWWRNPEAAQLELWRASNKRALGFAQQYLNDRYHIVRYEDLCRKPVETISAVMVFLGRPDVNIAPLIDGIRDRGNIGRWRRDQTSKVVELSRAIQADLERFGYES